MFPPDPAAVFDRPLPYVDQLCSRSRQDVKRIVLHCTELPDLSTAREYGERVLYASGTGNSGHYYIDRDGRIERWVPDDRIAHHVRGHNADSIGIELVHTGRWPDWYDSRRQRPGDAYPDVQIQSLIGLIRALRIVLPNINALAGHEDLDRETIPASDDPSQSIQRKIDPGPTFPWPRVLHESGLPRPLPAPSDQRSPA